MDRDPKLCRCGKKLRITDVDKYVKSYHYVNTLLKKATFTFDSSYTNRRRSFKISALNNVVPSEGNISQWFRDRLRNHAPTLTLDAGRQRSMITFHGT
jgi:6-pyruvoyl-tetrahydropterin synthase